MTPQGLYKTSSYRYKYVGSYRLLIPNRPTIADNVPESSAVETLQNQFSGYGSTSTVIINTLDSLRLKAPLETWDSETVHAVVSAFVTTKFPTVLALNKIDHPDADANIARIAKSHPPESLVLCSAISEVFLRRLAKQKYVRYVEGSEIVDTRGDLVQDGDPDGGGLKELDEKLKTRIENLKDMVLYRFGSTGVVQVLTRAAEMLGLVPFFPVKNAHAFGMNGQLSEAEGVSSAPSGGQPVFRDCVLVRKGMTVRDVARKIIGDAPLAYVEGIGGVRVSEDEIVGVGKCDVSPCISFLYLYQIMNINTAFYCHLSSIMCLFCQITSNTPLSIAL